MAVTDWWLGEPGANSATVVCRSDTTATVSVGCNGGTFTGEADTAVSDGIVAIPVTGLTPGQEYAYTIDGAAGGTLNGKKASGDLWIAIGSCWLKTVGDPLANVLLRDHDIDLYMALGDFPYCNSALTEYGETTVSVEAAMANGKSAAVYNAHHRQQRRIPGMKELMRSVPLWYMPDDHEYPFNDACPTWLAGYQSVVGGAGAATQTDLDEAWAASRSAIKAYQTGFNRAVTADADAIYGSYRLGNTEIFLLDCCNYRSPIIDTDNASKTMLGATQKAWLIAAVAASTATFKMIVSGKQLFKSGGNTDTWNASGANLGYETEKMEILYALRTVTGMFFVAGDQHLWSDQWVAAGDLGVGYPAVSCLVGCPTTVAVNTTGVAGYLTGVRSKQNGYHATTNVAQENVVALLRITADRVYRYHLSIQRGLISRGYIDAGSNQVQYPQMRFG